MIWVFILGVIGVVCIFISIFSSFEQRNKNLGGEVLKREKAENVTVYAKKRIMTDYEYNFYLKLRELESRQYKVIPQLNLATIVKKINNNRYYSELFRNIDFAIFNCDYSEVLLLIELNDSTHNQMKRKDRDLKVQTICNDIQVPLMKFYTNYPNEKDYVINRILKAIDKA